MLLSLLSGITQHTTITLNLFSEFQILIIIDNYRYFFAICSIIYIKKSTQQDTLIIRH